MTDAAGETRVRARREGPVLVLTLDGAAIRNALGPAVYADLTAQVEAARHDSAIRAIIVTGAGGYFCAGGNIQSLRQSAQGTLAEAEARTDRLNAMIQALVDSPLPVIAAIEGGAAGAGLALALACDLIVSSETASCTLAYVKIGLSPDGGVTHLLRAALPRQMVMEMGLLGRPVPAARLAELGVISALTPPGAALDTALNLARDLAAGPRTAQARIKHQINTAAQTDLATQQRLEARDMNTARFGPEAAEGLAAFLEKRIPRFPD